MHNVFQVGPVPIVPHCRTSLLCWHRCPIGTPSSCAEPFVQRILPWRWVVLSSQHDQKSYSLSCFTKSGQFGKKKKKACLMKPNLFKSSWGIECSFKSSLNIPGWRITAPGHLGTRKLQPSKAGTIHRGLKSGVWVPVCLVYLSGTPDVVLFKNPSAFPERLWDCLKRHTNSDPEAQGSQVVLNTYFISQSAPDICRKLQKLAIGPNTNSAWLTETAFRVFNNRCDRGWKRRQENDSSSSRHEVTQGKKGSPHG